MVSRFFCLAGMCTALLISSMYLSVYSMETVPLLKKVSSQHSKKITADQMQGTRAGMEANTYSTCDQKEDLLNEYLNSISLALFPIAAHENEKDSLISAPQSPTDTKDNSLKPTGTHQQDIHTQELYEMLIKNPDTVLQNQDFAQIILCDLDSLKSVLQQRHHQAAHVLKPLASSSNFSLATFAQLYLGVYYTKKNFYEDDCAQGLSYLNPVGQQNEDLWAKTNAWYYIGRIALYQNRHADLNCLIKHDIEKNCHLLSPMKRARLWIMLAEYYWRIRASNKIVMNYCQRAVNQKDCSNSVCDAYTCMATFYKRQGLLEWAKFYAQQGLNLTKSEDVKKRLLRMLQKIENKQNSSLRHLKISFGLS